MRWEDARANGGGSSWQRAPHRTSAPRGTGCARGNECAGWSPLRCRPAHATARGPSPRRRSPCNAAQTLKQACTSRRAWRQVDPNFASRRCFGVAYSFAPRPFAFLRSVSSLRSGSSQRYFSRSCAAPRRSAGHAFAPFHAPARQRAASRGAPVSRSAPLKLSQLFSHAPLDEFRPHLASHRRSQELAPLLVTSRALTRDHAPATAKPRRSARKRDCARPRG